MPATKQKKVLIIDDDESTLESVGALLERAGLTVLTATSAFGATNLLTREKPGLVLLDVDMPGLRGDALVKGVLAPAGINRSDIAIVFHSGRSAGELARLTRECEVDGYIEKSLEPSLLLAAVFRYLRSRQSVGP